MINMSKSLEDICETLEEKYISFRESAENRFPDLYSRIYTNCRNFNVNDLPKYCIERLVAAKNWVTNAFAYAVLGGTIPSLISEKLEDNERFGKYFEQERNFKYSIGFGMCLIAAYVIGGLVVAPAVLNSDLFTSPERIRELNLVWDAIGGAAVVKAMAGYGLRLKDYIKSGRENTKEFVKKNLAGMGIDALCLMGGSYLLASSIPTELVRKFVSLFSLGSIGTTAFDISARLGINYCSRKFMDKPLYPATLIPNEAAGVMGYLFYRTLTNIKSPVQSLKVARHDPAEEEPGYDLSYTLTRWNGSNSIVEDNKTIGELEEICKKLGKDYGGRKLWKMVIPREISGDLSELPLDKQEYIRKILNPVQK